MELAGDLPSQLRRALNVLDDGGFDVHLTASELEPPMSRVERLGNRFALSVLVAALTDAGDAASRAEQSQRGRGRMAGVWFK